MGVGSSGKSERIWGVTRLVIPGREESIQQFKLKGENVMLKGYTPHIAAAPEDFAKVVLMPGDPLRARFIAENYMENARLVNNVRGVQGYTGFYKGTEVSVMASGMGMPSMGIYSYELYHFFDVDTILRVGSAGAIQADLPLHRIVLGMGASTDSNYVHQYHLPGGFAPLCSYQTLKICTKAAEELGYGYTVGNLLSTDVFYNDEERLPEIFRSVEAYGKMGVLAVEMEAAALYMNAARFRKNALAICTISDSLITGEALSAAERQESFTEMMELALLTAKKLTDRD